MAEKQDIKFALGKKWGDALQEWHRGLGDNRGDRAALKKCRSLTEVVFVPSYHQLYQDITDVGREAVEAKVIKWPWASLEGRIRERLPMIASLTALVNPESLESGTEASEQSLRLPCQMGTVRVSGGGPVVSDLRFRRLLKCRTPEELYPALRRVIGLLDNKADIMSLAQSVFYWSEDMRKEWAYDYYASDSQQTE